MLPGRSCRFLRISTALLLVAAALAASGGSVQAEAQAATEVVCGAELRSMDDRQQLRLEPAQDSDEIRLGLAVSDSDAARIDRLTEVRSKLDFDELRAELVETLGDDLVSVTWSFVDGVEVRVRPAADAESVDGVRTKHSLGDDISVLVVPDAAFSERERVELVLALQEPEALAKLTEAGVFSVETDEYCGTVTLLALPGVDASAAQDRLARSLPIDRVTIRQADKSELDNEATGRDDLQTTQSGGLRVRASGFCTSAAPWYANVWTPFGTVQVRYAVTAAHCVNQSQWSSTPNNWGGVWWTLVTAETDLRQPSTTIASGQARLRYGAELDVAVWPLDATYQNGSPRSATNSDAHNYIWHNLGWWQWSPTWVTSTSGGDAVGDWVCQSGQTTAWRAPDPAWNTSVIECGSLFDRARAYSIGSPNASWFYSMREASLNVCGGDSGGTVWRAGWYSGIVKSGRRGSLPDVNGQPCYEDTTYSHIGYMPGAFGLTAPVGFS